MKDFELIERATRAHARNSSDAHAVYQEPSSYLSRVSRTGGKTQVVLRNGYGVVARFNVAASGRMTQA